MNVDIIGIQWQISNRESIKSFQMLSYMPITDGWKKTKKLREMMQNQQLHILHKPLDIQKFQQILTKLSYYLISNNVNLKYMQKPSYMFVMNRMK
ncbi:unnamed protein product [Paramecium octaurelia]|uniref:Uncharacterized protein n=1 Tax=Paramecium octaurelia TaxID=43137 RepID=A0A8S1VQ82_PAROT|nr:unnamed protein product [Paramecium octaurelia]